jgi:hypothetical protein
MKNLQKQLDNANKRLRGAYKKPYYNLTEEKRILGQIEKWSSRVDDLTKKINKQ